MYHFYQKTIITNYYKHTMKKITKNIALFIITLGILSSPFSVHAATWVGPTTTPPGNNVSAPVNVGPVYQIKTGDLGVFSFFANYIRSLGTISANRYCFNSGASNGRDTNCITSWPTGGTGTGIESIIAGTNVTVDNTDPLNPIVSSTATSGVPGADIGVRINNTVVTPAASTLNFTGPNMSAALNPNGWVNIAVTPNKITKDGALVHGWANTLNFTGNNITTTNNNGIVSIGVDPATPTAVLKDGIQVSAAPLALDFTGSNISATNTNGVVKIVVAPATPTAIQKDGIQVSAAPLAVNFRGNNITTLNTNGVVNVDVKNLAIQKNGVVVSNNPPTLNFTGNNFTTFTNVDGTVNLDIKTKISAVNEGAVIGNDFHTIDFGAGGLLATDAGSGVLMVGFDPTALGSVLPSPSPADRTLRSNGTAWVQSPLVKHTISSFQVNRPIADNSTENIFHAAKMYNVFGNPVPLIGLFVTKDGDTYVNGAKFRHSGIAGTTATPTNSFGTDDIFQSSINSAPNQKGLAVRADGGVRVRGELSALNNAVVPLLDNTVVPPASLFLGANDIFHVVGELNGAKKGFGLAVDGTTRVEGILAVNGGQALIGDMIHMGNTTQTGNVNQTGNTIQTGNYTMQGSGATMTLGDTTNAAQLNITGNATQAGNYIQIGNFDQDGDYTLQGNIVQTGNINTNGRWAVVDTTAPSASTNPPFGAPVTYSFLASAGVGGANGSIGLTRYGDTKVVGSMQVTGPASVTGSLSVDGWIQSDTLVNTTGDRPVCADTFGRLKICASQLPVVTITSIGNVTLENEASKIYAFTKARTYYFSGQTSVPNPTQSGTINYTISGATAALPYSCSRTSTPSTGTATGWNTTSNFSVTTPAYVGNTVVNVTSYEPTVFRVTCTNVDGQSAFDAATIKGHGSWATASGSGTFSTGNFGTITFPQVPMTVSLVSGGGGGGGSFMDAPNNITACGGGGGSGHYKSATRNGGAIPNIRVGAGGNGGAPNAFAAQGAYGGYGEETRFGNYVDLIATGGYPGGPGMKTGSSTWQGGFVGTVHGVGGSGGTASAFCTFGVGKVPNTTWFGLGTGGRGGWVGSIANGFGTAGEPGMIEVVW